MCYRYDAKTSPGGIFLSTIGGQGLSTTVRLFLPDQASPVQTECMHAVVREPPPPPLFVNTVA